MNVRFLHDGEPGQERLQVVLTGQVVIQSLRGWELTISFHIQFCIMTLAIFFFLCILSPWWFVHWVLARGSKHSASRWTADERPAWRSQSPATAGKHSSIKNHTQVQPDAFVYLYRHYYGCFCALTTWLSVITRSRVSQQDLTDPRGNVPISSFRRPSTCSVVVSSLLPEGGEERHSHNYLPCFVFSNLKSVWGFHCYRGGKNIMVHFVNSNLYSLVRQRLWAPPGTSWGIQVYLTKKSLSVDCFKG